jgi:hypothetical protein
MLLSNFFSGIIIILFFVISGCRSDKNVITIDDSSGIYGGTNAPVWVELELDGSKLEAARENRLALQEITGSNDNRSLIPVQMVRDDNDEGMHKLIFIIPQGSKGRRQFKLAESDTPFDPLVLKKDSKGQYVTSENGEKVLQYNYQTVYRDDVVRDEKERREEYTRNERDTFTVTSIYAVPRSDYIHPLYGLEGEMLTRDWPSEGHPHHRGIFWAWPEVYYGSELGDIYALQRVFARPTGNIETTQGPVCSEIKAENLWMWENTEPVVSENAVIRIYRSSPDNRIIDLTLYFLALKDSITIATRYTDSYGGLNLRMQTPEEQDISNHTDSVSEDPQRAWSDFNGIFEGNNAKTGLMVLQHKSNPEYPGAWVEYPQLAWVQPTFPAPGTRYPLKKDEPLILRYRLIVHRGGRPDNELFRKRWDAYHSDLAPMCKAEGDN